MQLETTKVVSYLVYFVFVFKAFSWIRRSTCAFTRMVLSSQSDFFNIE